MSTATATRAPGRGVIATWRYTLASVMFFYLIIDSSLVLGFFVWAMNERSWGAIAVTALSLVAVGMHLCSCFLLRDGLGGGWPNARLTTILLAPSILLWIIAFTTPNLAFFGAVPLWLSLALFVCLVPRAQRVALIVGAFIVSALPAVVQHFALGNSVIGAQSLGWWMYMAYVIAMPFLILTSVWWWLVVVRLDESRAVSAELAVTEERLRFASDLHDIQGHHLQVIALKAELAERLLERDPAAAAAHLHEVRVTAKTAMEETRALVAGLREVGLEAEIANAAEVLELSGASCAVHLDWPLPDTTQQRLFAMGVREATTNILRHSNAAEVSISLTRQGDASVLTIMNDGATSPSSEAPHVTLGTGIAGLRLRAEALGGTLTVVNDHETGRFSPTITAPQPAPQRKASL